MTAPNNPERPMSEPSREEVETVLSSELARRGHRLAEPLLSVLLGCEHCGGATVGGHLELLDDAAELPPVHSGRAAIVVGPSGFHCEQDAVWPAAFAALDEAFKATRSHFGLPNDGPCDESLCACPRRRGSPPW